MTNEGPPRRRDHLIVLRHVVVAQDIAQTIAEAEPGAFVIVATSPAEAIRAIEGVERLGVAFVAEGPRNWEGSDLARAVAARGGRVVLLGEAAEAEGRQAGFRVLLRPFTSADVLACLRG